LTSNSDWTYLEEIDRYLTPAEIRNPYPPARGLVTTLTTLSRRLPTQYSTYKFLNPLVSRS